MIHDDLMAQVMALLDDRDYSVLGEGRLGWFAWFDAAASGEWGT